MAEKIKFSTVESARIKVDNTVDTAKKYDITAFANLQLDEVKSVDNGMVKTDGETKASFSHYGGNLSMQYNNVSQIEEMMSIMAAINEFVTLVMAAKPTENLKK